MDNQKILQQFLDSFQDNEIRNIIAAAIPELPARLQIVYGNKWVDGVV